MSRADALLFELKRGWVAYVVIACILVSIFALSLVPLWKDAEHGPNEKARIVWIGLTTGSKYRPQIGMGVSAEDSDGLTGTASFFPPSDIRGCKVGDEIEVERIGATLKLHPKPCA